MSRVVSASIARDVQSRANRICEYCLFPEMFSSTSFHIEHIIALYHDGASSIDNLAWSCNFCNLRKGTNLAAVDPETGRIHILFNPRKQKWRFHFELRDGVVVPRTAKGRATLALLKMNDGAVIDTRQRYFSKTASVTH